MPHNFVIFMPDEMRAESVACYGHPLVQTPNIDRLAGEGTRFDQCHVQHTVCSPSRCSMMTGWYPHVVGARTLWRLLRPHEPNLFRYLKSAGYEVVWFGKNDLLSPESFADSVSWCESRRGKGRPHSAIPFKLDDPRYYSFIGAPYETLDGPSDHANVHAALDYLNSRPSGPFMVYLPLQFPHPIYHAPEPYHSMYAREEIPELRPPDLPDKPSFYEAIRRTRRLNELDDGRFREIQALYLGMISYNDWLLGEVLECLAANGYEENTTILFFSDHGDWAGDYGLVEKWPSGLDDTLTRVPLVIRTPGGAEGHVVEEQAELFDIMPTILELAGIEPRHTHFAESLVPQLRGAAGNPERAVHAEGGYDLHEPHCFEGYGDENRGPEQIYYPKFTLQQDEPLTVCRATMIRTTDWKLIRRPAGVSELYDLRNDPRELTNLYANPAQAEVRRALEKRALDWYVRTADVTPFDRDPRPGQTIMPSGE